MVLRVDEQVVQTRGDLSRGAGVVFAFTDAFAVQLDLGVMWRVPSSGLVLEPSLGLLYAP